MLALSALGGRIETLARQAAAVDTIRPFVRDMRPTFYDTRSELDKWAKG
jgi:hypothetical protein